MSEDVEVPKSREKLYPFDAIFRCPACRVAYALCPPEFHETSFDTFDTFTPERAATLARAREFGELPEIDAGSELKAVGRKLFWRRRVKRTAGRVGAAGNGGAQSLARVGEKTSERKKSPQSSRTRKRTASFHTASRMVRCRHCVCNLCQTASIMTIEAPSGTSVWQSASSE